MAIAKSTYSDNLLDKLKQEFGFRFDSELASLLEIAPYSLSSWRKRDAADFRKIIFKCPEVNLNWLFRGIGSPRMESIAYPLVAGDRAFSIAEDDLVVPVIGRTLMGGEKEPIKLDSVSSHGMFFRHFLESGVIKNPDDVFICEVSNLAMSGLFDAGDLAIAEKTETIDKRGIYVFWRNKNIEGWHVDTIDGEPMMVPHYTGVKPIPLVIDDDCTLMGIVKGAILNVFPMQEKWAPPIMIQPPE